MNQLRSNAATIGADDGQAVAFRADGKFAVRKRIAIFHDELCNSRLFVRGQFFDLLNDFKRTHGLIIRQNLFLASRIASVFQLQNYFPPSIFPVISFDEFRLQAYKIYRFESLE